MQMLSVGNSKRLTAALRREKRNSRKIFSKLLKVEFGPDLFKRIV